MTVLEMATVLLQLVVPLLLTGWVAAGRRGGPTAVLDVALAAAYLVAIAVAAPWLALPREIFWLLALALAGAALARVRRSGAGGAPRTQSRPLRAAGTLVRVVTMALAAWVIVVGVSGRRPFPGPAVELDLPLRGAGYLVAAGGSRELINPHLKTLRGDRFAAYRGQSYAVDLVRLGRWGSRRAGLSPDRPEGFAIFGDSLFAPCTGEVVQAADGVPDGPAIGDAPYPREGNHVLLECGEAWVLLAHLQQGSVKVRQGDRVAAGDHLGQVGNSGASDEPHLHIHAQRPGSAQAPLAGEPLPIAFGGRQLARNARIDGR